MLSILTASLTAIALQAAPATTQAAPPASFDAMPVTVSTAPRCGIAFATVEGWQDAGDERGARWPDIQALGGREFFVQAMVQLIDRYGLEREDVQRLVAAEVASHDADGGAAVQAMMPACLTLIETTASSTE